MKKTIKDEIKETLRHIILTDKTTTIPTRRIRYVLLTVLNKRTLMYSQSVQYMKKWLEIANELGYGEYDTASQVFKVNEENSEMAVLIYKNEDKSSNT